MVKYKSKQLAQSYPYRQKPLHTRYPQELQWFDPIWFEAKWLEAMWLTLKQVCLFFLCQVWSLLFPVLSYLCQWKQTHNLVFTKKNVIHFVVQLAGSIEGLVVYLRFMKGEHSWFN